MATTRDARFVQDRLGYRFKDEAILCLALTAAGKGGAKDGPNKRGNSRLAHLGNFLMQFLLAWIGFGDDRTRADTSTLATRFNSADHCAKVAEKAELDRCLKYDMWSGSRSAVVLRKAVNAIMAAIFLDSQDIHQVLMAVTNLGLFGHDDFGVDPRLLSTSQITAAELFRQVILANTFPSAVEGGLTQTSGRIA
ncbi:Ribonuclease [Aspergillus udagawae]|nr:Ribonuclease [Aspergillus udagawae]